MNLKIEIEKKGILHSVKLETFVSGESTKEKEGTLSTMSQADDDNDDILNEYMATAKGRVIDLLSGLLECKSPETILLPDESSPETYTYALSVPCNFDYNQKEGIAQGIKDLMVNFILFNWYNATWPDKARLYQSHIDDSISNIKHRLNQRSTPIRRPVRPLGF